MREHYDDMMRNRLNNHESEVPPGMFDDIRNKLDAIDQSFDAAVNGQLTNYASAVPANMFDGISSRMDDADNAFDAALGSRINPYESSIPADMWQRIMKEKDRRRPVAWWWAAALLFLSVGGGGFFYYQQQQSKPVTAAVGKTSTPVSKNAINKKDHINQNPGAADGEKTTDRNSIKNSSDGSNQSGFNAGSSPVSGNDFTTVNHGGFFSPQTKNKIKNNRQKNGGGFAGGETDDLHLQNGTSANTNRIDGSDLMTNAEKQLALRQLIRSSFNKLLPLQLLQANLKTPIIPCPLNGDEPRSDWYVDVYVSPMTVFKTVTDKVAGKNIRTGMDSTLHKQVSFNAGINLVKNIGENFLLKTGLQYNQVNEVFRNTRVNEIKLITTVTIRTIILAPGDTIYIRDTSVTQQIGTVTRQTQNRYKSWDIPLIMGYEFGGKDLRLNANVGVIANIRSSYKGEMLDTIQQTINIADYKATGVYKTNIGLGIYAGLGIVKAIGDKTDLLIEPYARFNLTNMTTDAAWFKQKNIVAGLSVGLRYKLNGRRQR